MKVGVGASVALLAGFALVGASCLQILGGDDRLGTAGSGGTSGSSSSPTIGAPCDFDAVKELGKSAKECEYGGTSNAASFTTRCAAGDVVIGAFVYTAAYLDRFGVLCAPLLKGEGGAGEEGPDLCAAYAACWGGKSQNKYLAEVCPSGQALVKLGYTLGNDNGSHVDQVTLYCQKPSSWMNMSPTPDSTRPPLGGSSTKHLNFVWPCPAGQVATGFSGQIGSWVTSLTQISCTTP